MRLEIVDRIYIESIGSFNSHEKLIQEKINSIYPKYYVIETDLQRCLWVTKILIMEEVGSQIID